MALFGPFVDKQTVITAAMMNLLDAIQNALSADSITKTVTVGGPVGATVHALVVNSNSAASTVLIGGSNSEGLRIDTTGAAGSFLQTYNSGVFCGFMGSAQAEFGGALADFAIGAAAAKNLVLGVGAKSVLFIKDPDGTQDGVLMQRSFNGTLEFTVQNLSAAALAYGAIALKNSVHGAAFVLTSNGYVGSYLTNGPAGESMNIYTAFATPLSLGVNNIAGINFDLLNRITLPSQPTFTAHRSASDQVIATSATTALVFDSFDVNKGPTTAYSNATGLFTAPIGGMYLFVGSCRVKTGGGGTSTTPDVYFTKNAAADGTAVTTRQLSAGALSTTIPANTPIQFSGSCMLSLVAGDTVGISCHTGADPGGAMSLIASMFSAFDGLLLG